MLQLDSERCLAPSARVKLSSLSSPSETPMPALQSTTRPWNTLRADPGAQPPVLLPNSAPPLPRSPSATPTSHATPELWRTDLDRGVTGAHAGGAAACSGTRVRGTSDSGSCNCVVLLASAPARCLRRRDDDVDAEVCSAATREWPETAERGEGAGSPSMPDMARRRATSLACSSPRPAMDQARGESGGGGGGAGWSAP